MGTKDQSHEWWTDVVKVAFTCDQYYRIKEIGIKNQNFNNCSESVT